MPKMANLKSLFCTSDLISTHVILLDLAKVEAMLYWECLKNVLEIRSFKGLVGYYRRSIEGLPKIVALVT